MNPILLVIIAVALLGMVFWFKRYVAGSGEPAGWFTVWLITGSISALFAAASWWIDDPTISLSFFTAFRCTLAVSVFIFFVFARSFSHPSDYTLLFWSIPLQFDVAQNIVNSEQMFRGVGEGWALNIDNPFVVISHAITFFYVVLALYNFLLLYNSLRRAGKAREMRQVLLFTISFCVMFLMMFLESQLRSWLEVKIPVGGIGILIAAFLMILAFRKPFAVSPDRERTGVP